MLLIVSQVIGLGAVALYLLSYQLKKRRQIVSATCISNLLYVLQYILLGAFSGAVMDTLSAVGSFLAGRRVGQLVFAKMDETALNPYNGKYQGQRGATGSRVFMDKEIK